MKMFYPNREFEVSLWHVDDYENRLKLYFDSSYIFNESDRLQAGLQIAFPSDESEQRPKHSAIRITNLTDQQSTPYIFPYAMPFSEDHIAEIENQLSEIAEQEEWIMDRGGSLGDDEMHIKTVLEQHKMWYEAGRAFFTHDGYKIPAREDFIMLQDLNRVIYPQQIAGHEVHTFGELYQLIHDHVMNPKPEVDFGAAEPQKP